MIQIVFENDKLPQSVPSNIPDPGAMEVLAETKLCGICGTDIYKIKNALLKNPTVLGHEWVGRIVKVGHNMPQELLGKVITAAHHVACDHCDFCKHGAQSMCAQFKATNFKPGGFASHVILNKLHLDHVAHDASGIHPKQAIMVEPLACCLRNIWRLPLQKSDPVLVIGLGSIGIKMLLLLRNFGFQGFGIDPNTSRIQFVRDHFGLEAKTPNNEKSLMNNYQALIFTAGHASVLNDWLPHLRPGGCINLFAGLDGELPPDFLKTLYHHEIQIMTTYSSNTESIREAHHILSSGKINLEALVEKIYKPENINQALEDIRNQKVIKAAISFDS